MPKKNQEAMNPLIFDNMDDYNRYIVNMLIQDINNVDFSTDSFINEKNTKNYNKDTGYHTYVNMLVTIIGDNLALYEIIDSIIDEDDKFGKLLPCLVQTLYHYHITGEKLKKLWEISCNQNKNIFKLTLFLFNSFQYNQSLEKYIKQNLEKDEPISFIENPISEQCQTILEDNENWEIFCNSQAEYIINASKQEKIHTK